METFDWPAKSEKMITTPVTRQNIANTHIWTSTAGTTYSMVPQKTKNDLMLFAKAAA